MNLSKTATTFRMAFLHGFLSITDVHSNFQSGRVFYTLPKGGLEEVLKTNCDRGLAKIIEDNGR